MISFASTRGGAAGRSFEDVLLTGLAEDGGLFVPESWPSLDLASLKGLSYAQTAARVIEPFCAGCFGREELAAMCEEAYAGFAHPAVAPLRQLDHDSWLLELFHGPTLAFKDFALQLLGRMFERVLARSGRSITIVGATSGDTGSAAIHACAGRANMNIVILHPEGRVSPVQRRQMTTVDAANVANVAVRGTFDDCQDLVKAMFGDAAFRDEMGLAAINSINWARVMAQAAYYVYAALRLGGLERPLAFSVPTGNFGDVYAGYVAHRMGLPVERLVIATNRNDILTRFIETGRYEAGEVFPTSSPSMDIQVASNFERLLFEIEGRDGAAVQRLMAGFRQSRALEVSPDKLALVRRLFAAGRTSEAETAATIRRVLEETGTLVDTHTAVGIHAGTALATDGAPLVTLSTAHPAKFPDAVKAAAGVLPQLPPHMADLMERCERFDVLDNDLVALQTHVRNFVQGTS